MDENIFLIVEFLTMAAFAIATALITSTLIPWMKGKLSAEQLESVRKWAETFVLMAEQVFGSKTGQEKKLIVTERLNSILRDMKIYLSSEQISDLIEAAVKGMRIAENAGVQTSKTENKGDDSNAN